MKLVILAGGQKSAISGEEEGVPKPMIQIGGRPLLWHIMKHASLCGIKEFIICGGYKVEQIKEYFRDFYVYQSDIAINIASNTVEILKKSSEDWNVIVADTGLMTSPIGRVKKVCKYIEDDSFLISYGDCLTDLSFQKLEEDFRNFGGMMTVAVAHPSGRKVPLSVGDFQNMTGISQRISGIWTSAGIFAVKKELLDKVEVEGDIEEILYTIDSGQISVYKHDGFWNTIETLRDKVASEHIWERGEAPWI